MIVILFFLSRPRKEGFGTILGAAGPYQAQYSQCINQCNRSDPSNHLLKGANINCGVYCDAVISKLAEKGIPAELVPLSDNQSICEKQCANPTGEFTHDEVRSCVSMCTGQRNVMQYCKEIECPYSIINEDECISQCVRTKTTNNNQNDWHWDMTR